MPQDYIPAKDNDLLSWASNFNNAIASDWTDFGLIEAQATAFNVAFDAYASALAAATEPATRTSVTVAAKDAARFALVALARELANVVQAWPAITPSLLTTLGLTVRDPIPTPIPAPNTTPTLALIEAQPLRHVLRFNDDESDAPRAKPFGATGLEVWVKLDGPPPAGISECQFRGTVSRVPFNIDFAEGDGGKTAHYLARWVNRKGQPGPTGEGLSLTVMG